jgi:stearoyl-CoA desaturase (delta-9 desaturase)
VADEKTLEALIANRYELMATYAKGMRQAARDELAGHARAQRGWCRHQGRQALDAPRWTWCLHRPLGELAKALAASPMLDKMVTMREELRQMWLNTSVSREQLTKDLQAWCQRAEESGIAALREFSLRLRAAHV